MANNQKYSKHRRIFLFSTNKKKHLVFDDKSKKNALMSLA